MGESLKFPHSQRQDNPCPTLDPTYRRSYSDSRPQMSLQYQAARQAPQAPPFEAAPQAHQTSSFQAAPQAPQAPPFQAAPQAPQVPPFQAAPQAPQAHPFQIAPQTAQPFIGPYILLTQPQTNSVVVNISLTREDPDQLTLYNSYQLLCQQMKNLQEERAQRALWHDDQIRWYNQQIAYYANLVFQQQGQTNRTASCDHPKRPDPSSYYTKK